MFKVHTLVSAEALVQRVLIKTFGVDKTTVVSEAWHAAPSLLARCKGFWLTLRLMHANAQKLPRLHSESSNLNFMAPP